MIRQAAARNRTLAAEGTRTECVDLKEIDMYATKADIIKQDLTLPNVVKTGSMWTQSTNIRTGNRGPHV